MHHLLHLGVALLGSHHDTVFVPKRKMHQSATAMASRRMSVVPSVITHLQKANGPEGPLAGQNPHAPKAVNGSDVDDIIRNGLTISLLVRPPPRAKPQPMEEAPCQRRLCPRRSWPSFSDASSAATA